ncbi:MAG TPA: AI-2E family transporter [Patescibacteria group bacterium]|nr:AI-2E family transporter [Patescibacteria group bacterium]
MPRKIEISYRTIVFTTIFVAFIWLLFQIRSIILALFIALILMSALNPSVKRLEQLRFPRWLAILLTYFAILAILAFGVGGIVPPLVEQTSSLINQLPNFFRQFQFLGIDEKMIATQLTQFSTIPANLIKFIFSLFSNLVGVLALGVITFYLLMERQNLDYYLKLLFGEGNESKVQKVIDKIEVRLGGWVRGEIVLMTFVGILTYIGFRLIGLPYALPLAILAFLLEIIPNVGPILSTFPAVIIGLTISPFHAVAAAALGFLVQQIENTILVPRVMKQVVGINPLITIISLAIGFKLAGVGGAILAVPIFIALEEITAEISHSKRFNRA